MSNNNSWQKVRFYEICKNISDRIDDPKQADTDYYVGLEHLDSEDPKISRHGSPQDVSKTKLLFKSGHILFGKRNWYLRRLAVAQREGICSAHMLVLEPIEGKITKEFLPLLMFSDDFFEKALMVSAGSMSPTIKWKDLASLQFFLPPIEQQENILSITDKIDQTISDAQNLLEKTKNYMVSRRELLLTRGIGHTKFKKVPWYYGKTIEIPEEWELQQLGNFMEIKMGQSPPSASYNDKNEGLPFYQGVTDFENIYPNATMWCTDPKKIANKNEILFSVRAPVGEINITKDKCCLGRGVASLNPLENNLLYCFYLILNNKNNFLNFQQGTTFTAINQNELSSIKIPFTSNKEEQQKIMSILTNINKQITQQQSHLTNLKVLRKSILNSRLTKEKTNVIN